MLGPRRTGPNRGPALSRLADNWDNDDVRVRPARRTRPRTKTRPAHLDAQTAMVIAVDRGRYTCLVETGRTPVTVTAMRARELGRRAVAVGDNVELVGDTSGAPDSLARIVRIGERRSVLRRSADDTDPAERVLVANADQLVIVTALADPVPRTGFIDRCLVAAYTGDLDPVLVLTKSDIADPAELLAAYADLDLTVLVTGRGDGRTVLGLRHGRGGTDRADVRAGRALRRRQVDPGERAGAGRGPGHRQRHRRRQGPAHLDLGGGAATARRRLGDRHPRRPIVRLWPTSPRTTCCETFDDLLPATVDCPPNCDHTGPDGDGLGTGCALDGWVAAGHATPGRLASFRRLLASRAAAD